MGKVCLAITIDTEKDATSTSWRGSNPVSYKSVQYGIPERLQPLFNLYGAKPTYLISPEIFENPECISILRDLNGEAEFGTHLHPEYIDPKKKYDGFEANVPDDFPCDYIEDVEYAKIKNLTKLFEDSLRFKPRSFRAGRFGAGASTIRSLERLGYWVDSSVTPHLEWFNKISKITFRGAPEQPYYPDHDDLKKSGESNILEIPVTIRKRFGGDTNIVRRFRGHTWLRPTFFDSEKMKRVMEFYCNKYKNRPVIVLNMMFHSVEVIAEVNPYFKSNEECMKLLKRIEDILYYCTNKNITFCTLSEIYHLWRKS